MHVRFAISIAGLAVAVAACNDRAPTTAPASIVNAGMSFAISDGAHTAPGANGNPEFFFLPPLASDPSGSSNFSAGKFAWHMRPVVLVYALPTKSWNPGDGPDKCVFTSGAVYGPVLGVAQPPVEQYAVNWKTPTNLVLRTYRVCVFSSRGGTLLGFLDVQPVQGGTKSPKSSGGTYTFTRDGRTLPIKFRIETGALCPPAYDTECLSATTTLSTQVADTIILPSGHAALVIPPQATPPTGPLTIEFREESPPYNNSTTCLPPSLLVQSQGCYHASATSGGVAYAFNPAVTVEICVAVDQLTAEQASQLRLFKYNSKDGVQQWPWVEPTLIDCSTYAPLAPTVGALGAVLRRLGTLALSVLAPRPLLAARVSLPPKGVGGSDRTFSDFGGGLLSSVESNGGNDQTAPAGTPVPIPPSVVVHDTAGHPVSGVQVTFAVTSGGGRVISGEVIGDSVVATTGNDGIASLTSWILGPTAGTNSLSASAYEFVGSPVTFAATGTGPGPATRLVLTTPAAGAMSGFAFSTQPVVEVQDAVGNRVLSDNTTLVTMTVNLGATVLGTATVTTSRGVATFTNVGLAGTAGTAYTLTFATAPLLPTTQVITVAAAPASRLAITTQPSVWTQSGEVFTQQPVIQIEDAVGNAVNQSGLVVTASIAVGGGTLGGTLTVTTNTFGVATFTNLMITGSVGPRALSFTSVGLTSATSIAITVVAGPASQLAIRTQPSSSAQSGVAFTQQPVIQAVDAVGNAVGQGGFVVAASIASGAGTLGGTLTATTNTDGVATFTDLMITGSIGSRTLLFTSSGMVSPPSISIAVVAGPASQLTIMTQPSSSAQSGVAFTQQPVIQVVDAAGNTVHQEGFVVTASIASGGGTLGGTATATTDVNGVATFTDLMITGSSGSRTLSFASSGMVSPESTPIAVTAAP